MVQFPSHKRGGVSEDMNSVSIADDLPIQLRLGKLEGRFEVTAN